MRGQFGDAGTARIAQPPRYASITRDELFSTDEQLALARFLAGYGGPTRDAYTLDLRP